MKPLLTLALAFSLAPLVPVFADTPATKPATPAAEAPEPAADIYWDPTLIVGATPPEITGTDLSGKKVSLADFAGKPVLLDFWATWCPPCRAELPNVIGNYAKYHQKGLEIISVSLDNKKEALSKWIDDSKQMPWSQIYDRDLGDASNAKRYGVKAIPFMLLLGKDGKIAAVNPRGEELDPALQAATSAKIAVAATTATAATPAMATTK